MRLKFLFLVDWWGIGVLMIELMSGHSPFLRDSDDNEQELVSNRIKNQPPNIPDYVTIYNFTTD
jgi:serine/threonine protein kinase